jgi:hypothetical protein
MCPEENATANSRNSVFGFPAAKELATSFSKKIRRETDTGC